MPELEDWATERTLHCTYYDGRRSICLRPRIMGRGAAFCPKHSRWFVSGKGSTIAFTEKNLDDSIYSGNY